VKRRVAATVGSSERTILAVTHPFTHDEETRRGDRSLFGADDPRHDPSPHHDEETSHRDRSLFGVSDHDGPSPHRATR